MSVQTWSEAKQEFQPDVDLILSPTEAGMNWLFGSFRMQKGVSGFHDKMQNLDERSGF